MESCLSCIREEEFRSIIEKIDIYLMKKEAIKEQDVIKCYESLKKLRKFEIKI